jgi:hypothetical protein
MKDERWSHYNGRPTQMKYVMWQVWKMGLTWRSPEEMIKKGRKTWCFLIIPDRRVWKSNASWLHSWSFHFFEIFLTIRFISSSSLSKVTTMILCYYQLNDSPFFFLSFFFLFFCSPILLNYIEDFSWNKNKKICAIVRWHACILTWFEI